MTDLNNVTVTTKHNHAPSPDRVQASKIRSKIRECAVLTREQPRTVVNECLAGANDGAIAKLPKIQTLDKSVSRTRKRQGVELRIPHTLGDIQIPDDLRR